MKKLIVAIVFVAWSNSFGDGITTRGQITVNNYSWSGDAGGNSITNVASITDTNGNDVVALANSAVQKGANTGDLAINPDGSFNLKDDRIIIGATGTLLGQSLAYDTTNVVIDTHTFLVPRWYGDERWAMAGSAGTTSAAEIVFSSPIGGAANVEQFATNHEARISTIEDNSLTSNTWATVSGAATNAFVVTNPNGSQVGYATFSLAEAATTNGCRLDVYDDVSLDDNFGIFADNIYIDGHGNTITVTLDSIGSDATASTYTAAAVGGTGITWDNLNVRAIFNSGVSTNLAYCFTVKATTSTNVLVKNSTFQLEDNVGVVYHGSKTFVAVNGSKNVRVQNCNIALIDSLGTGARGSLIAVHDQEDSPVVFEDCDFVAGTNLYLRFAGGFDGVYRRCRINQAEAMDEGLAGMDDLTAMANVIVGTEDMFAGQSLNLPDYNITASSLGNRFSANMHYSLWDLDVKSGSGSHLDGGSTDVGSQVGLYLESGTTSNSYQTAIVPENPSFTAAPYIKAGNIQDDIDWQYPYYMTASFRVVATGSGARHKIEWGAGSSWSSGKDLSNHGISIVIENTDLMIQTYDSSLTESASLGTVTPGNVVKAAIYSDGAGNVKAVIRFSGSNVVYYETDTGPTGKTTFGDNIRVVAENVGSATAAEFVVGEVSLMLLDF